MSNTTDISPSGFSFAPCEQNKETCPAMQIRKNISLPSQPDQQVLHTQEKPGNISDVGRWSHEKKQEDKPTLFLHATGPNEGACVDFSTWRFRLFTFIKKGVLLCLVLAVASACIPSLLCGLLDVLTEFDPSPLRTFAVTCLRSHSDGLLEGSSSDAVTNETRNRSGNGIFYDQERNEEASACQALLSLRRNWGVRPPFGTYVTFLKAGTLCSLDLFRYIDLGPLLPEPETVQKHLKRLAPTLSSLFLLTRLSHAPVQPPCEEWLPVRAMANTRDMLHADPFASTKSEKQQTPKSTFDFVVVGGGAAGSTLAGLLSRVKRTEDKQKINDEKEGEKIGKSDSQLKRQKPRVLVLEAGGWPDLRSFSPLKVPARTYESQRGDMDWGLTTTEQPRACKGLQRGRSFWPRGKGLGGSSWLNYMLYVRGDPRDFDSFSNCVGDKRWKFRKVLKILKKFEDVHFPADPEFRGTGGPITVNLQTIVDPTVLAFVRSAEGLRLESEKKNAVPGDRASEFYAANPDYNGERYSGPSLFQFNTRHGRRRSPLEAFLFDAKMDESHEDSLLGDPTVSVVFHARAIKIQFESVGTQDICKKNDENSKCLGLPTSQWTVEPLPPTLRATGVLVVDDRECTAEKWEKEMCQVFEVPVSGELILTAGAIHTPQLLLQSGVGDAKTLEKLGLKTVVNLPGVGKNLQDHIFTPRLVLLKDSVPLHEFAEQFPPSTKAATPGPEVETQKFVERIDNYASLLHTEVALEVDRETKEIDLKASLSDKEKSNAPSVVPLSIRTANEHRGQQIQTVWNYLTRAAGLLASPGVEAQVVSEHFGELVDEENAATSLPSSCPHGSPAPDIQLHFLNGLPDASFMTSRLNIPKWFPFFIGTPEAWGSASHAPKLHGVVLMPVLLHPRSRGTVSLYSSVSTPESTTNLEEGETANTQNVLSSVNPMKPPLIDPQYLSSERDVDALVKGTLMVNKILSSGPFSLLVEQELRPHCRPEVWRQIFQKNGFTGDMYVGLGPLSNSSSNSSNSSSSSNSTNSSDSSSSSSNSSSGENSSESCSGSNCILSALEADIARQYPELETVDPMLPRLCALASAYETGKISVDEWMRGFVRLFTLTLYHPVGTCKMGKPDPEFQRAHLKRLYTPTQTVDFPGEQLHFFPNEPESRLSGEQTLFKDEQEGFDDQKNKEIEGHQLPPWSTTAVVDGALRLCGGTCVQNVRIADASVLPHLPSGNTHVPTILVAHIAAEDLAEKWKLSN